MDWGSYKKVYMSTIQKHFLERYSFNPKTHTVRATFYSTYSTKLRTLWMAKKRNIMFSRYILLKDERNTGMLPTLSGGPRLILAITP